MLLLKKVLLLVVYSDVTDDLIAKMGKVSLITKTKEAENAVKAQEQQDSTNKMPESRWSNR